LFSSFLPFRPINSIFLSPKNSKEFKRTPKNYLLELLFIIIYYFFWESRKILYIIGRGEEREKMTRLKRANIAPDLKVAVESKIKKSYEIGGKICPYYPN